MKKYVFLLSMALLALQFQSCSSSDDEPNEFNGKLTRSRVSGKIPGGGNTAPTEGPTFYMESSDDIKVVPEELTMNAEGGTDSITVYVNFDLNDNAYERAVFFDYGDKKAKPWLDGKWNDNNQFVITAECNDSSDPRTVILTFTISNADKSVNLEAQVLVTQMGVDNPGVIQPTLLEFPAEGGAKYVKYEFGGYKWMARKLTDEAKTWIKPAWSYDYYDENRFPQEMYVHVGPNTTNKARLDTIKMGFTMVKESPFENRFIIPIVVKQAAGPYTPKNSKSLIVGKWHHYIIGTNALTGKPNVEVNWDAVFNNDGTYSVDKHEIGINGYDYKFEGWEKGSYEITKVEMDDKNCILVYLNQTYTHGPTTAAAGYSSGSRETYFVVYPHFLLWRTGQQKYYDRVE